MRLLKALKGHGVHPRRAATDTSLPVPRKTLLIVAVFGVLVSVMVARLVQHSGPQASRLMVPGVPHAMK